MKRRAGMNQGALRGISVEAKVVLVDRTDLTEEVLAALQEDSVDPEEVSTKDLQILMMDLSEDSVADPKEDSEEDLVVALVAMSVDLAVALLMDHLQDLAVDQTVLTVKEDLEDPWVVEAAASEAEVEANRVGPKDVEETLTSTEMIMTTTKISTEALEDPTKASNLT
jgi:hypothetical protein